MAVPDWIRWFFVITYAGGIFCLSHQPELPGPPGGDKMAHIVVYGGLGFLLAWACLGSGPAAARTRAMRLAVAVGLGIGYGISDEFHQSFVPGRDPSFGDIIADAIGVILGASAFLVAESAARQIYRQRCAPSGAMSNSVMKAAERPPKETR